MLPLYLIEVDGAPSRPPRWRLKSPHLCEYAHDHYFEATSVDDSTMDAA